MMNYETAAASTNQIFHSRSHPGGILQPSDAVMGLPSKQLQYQFGGLLRAYPKDRIPDVIPARKAYYPNRRKKNKSINWRLTEYGEGRGRGRGRGRRNWKRTRRCGSYGRSRSKKGGRGLTSYSCVTSRKTLKCALRSISTRQMVRNQERIDLGPAMRNRRTKREMRWRWMKFQRLLLS